jgi:hypothetical protein
MRISFAICSYHLSFWYLVTASTRKQRSVDLDYNAARNVHSFNFCSSCYMFDSLISVLLLIIVLERLIIRIFG